MTDPKTAATQETAGKEGTEEKSLLGAADPAAGSEEKSLLNEAGAEEKEAQLVDEKRILEAKDEDLSVDERAKKVELVKAQEATKLADAAKAAAAAVPEKYEIKPPEGMQLDQAMMEKAAPLFKELKLSNEGAQKLANFYAATLGEIQQKQADALDRKSVV